jgi:hypothetical protein
MLDALEGWSIWWVSVMGKYVMAKHIVLGVFLSLLLSVIIAFIWLISHEDADDLKPIQHVDLRKWSTPLDPNTVEIVGSDLVVNGDFEDPNTAMWVASPNRWQIIDGTGRDNSRGSVLSPVDPNKFWVGCHQSIKSAKLPDVLLVTGWVRTKGLAPRKTAGFYVACTSSEVPQNRSPYGQTGNASSERMGGTSPWTKLIIAAPIHPATTSILVGGSAQSPKGKAFFDDIHAYPAIRKAERAPE